MQKNEKVEAALGYMESHPEALVAPGALSRALQVLKHPDHLGLTEQEVVEVLNRLDVPWGMGRLKEGV